MQNLERFNHWFGSIGKKHARIINNIGLKLKYQLFHLL